MQRKLMTFARARDNTEWRPEGLEIIPSGGRSDISTGFIRGRSGVTGSDSLNRVFDWPKVNLTYFIS